MCTGPHAYIEVPNVAKVDLIYTQLGERVMNSVYFQFTTPLSTAILTDLAAAVVASFPGTIADHMSNLTQLVLVRATDLSSEFGPAVEYVTGLPINGDQGAAIDDGGVTVATKFSTDGRGRSRRGRVFNVGLPTSQVANNRISDVWAAGITSDWEDFFDQVQGLVVDAEHTIVSLCADGTWRSEGLSTLVTGYSTDVYVDSQRRRLHGRGQ